MAIEVAVRPSTRKARASTLDKYDDPKADRATWSRVFRVKQLFNPLKTPLGEPKIHGQSTPSATLRHLLDEEQLLESERQNLPRPSSRVESGPVTNEQPSSPSRDCIIGIGAAPQPASLRTPCNTSSELCGLPPIAQTAVISKNVLVHQDNGVNGPGDDGIAEVQEQISNCGQQGVQAQELPASVNLVRNSTNNASPPFSTLPTNEASSNISAPVDLNFDPPQSGQEKLLPTLGSRNPWRNLIVASEQSPSTLLGDSVSSNDGREQQTGEGSNNVVYSEGQVADPGIYNEDADPLGHPFPTRRASTTRSSVDPSSLASTNPSSVPESDLGLGVANTLENVAAIPFLAGNVERVGTNCFMDRRAIIPDAAAQEWNHNVKPRFDENLRKIIGNISGKDYILSNTGFYMAGSKRGDFLFVEPTIVVTCGTKECKRVVRKSLDKSKLHYLERFGRPIKVRYQRPPSYWAAFMSRKNNSEPPALGHFTVIPYAFIPYGSIDLSIIWPTSRQLTALCGTRLELTVSTNSRQTSRVYATLGGIIYVDDKPYAMTTAHNLYPDVHSRQTSTEKEEVDYANSSYESDSDIELPGDAIFRAVPYTMPISFRHSAMYRKILWPLDSIDTVHISFGGSYMTRWSESQAPSIADWALFPLSEMKAHPNKHWGSDLSEIVPEASLLAGNVEFVFDHGIRKPTGYLTQTNASIQTRDGAMNVREIVLDEPLGDGASGSWVVQNSRICGYIVAISGRGLSCFMVPMERAFKDIETTLGATVSLLGDAQRATPAISRCTTIGHNGNRARELGDNDHIDELQGPKAQQLESKERAGDAEGSVGLVEPRLQSAGTPEIKKETNAAQDQSQTTKFYQRPTNKSKGTRRAISLAMFPIHVLTCYCFRRRGALMEASPPISEPPSS